MQKVFYIFIFLHMITNFKCRIFIITFYNRVNICVRYNVNRLHFDCSIIFTTVFINHIIWFINIPIFNAEVIFLQTLSFNVISQISEQEHTFLRCVLNTFLYCFLVFMILLIYCKIHYNYLHIFYLV